MDLRAHPFAGVAGARHLFVRGGVLGLVALDGFDLAVAGETGAAVTGGRLIGWASLGADRFLIGPRLVVLARLGVGVTF
jgi:hypothetical protein